MNKSLLAIENQLRNGVVVVDTARNNAIRLLSAFLSGRNKRTIQAYRQDLEDFRNFVQSSTTSDAVKHLLSGTHGDANAIALSYRSQMVERGLQSSTINRRLAAIRSMVKLARTLGMVSWSLDVENLKVQKYRDTKGPGQAGMHSIFEVAAGRTDAKGIRDYAILRLLHDLALRRGEVVGLDVADVDVTAGSIAILGKGRNQKDTLSLAEPTKDAIKAWLAIRGDDSGALFTNFDRAGKGHRLTTASIYWLVSTFGRRVGVKVRPHGIRHTAITAACKLAQANGVDLEEVLDFSRHTDVKTLMVYRDRERNVQGRLAALVAAAV